MERTKLDKAKILAKEMIELTNCYCVVESPLFCTQSDFENTNKRLWNLAKLLDIEQEVYEIISDYYNTLNVSFISEVANEPQDSESKEQS